MSETETIFHGVRDGKALWAVRQDVAPIIERNKQMQSDGGTETLSYGRVIADIPNVVVTKWMIEDGVPVLSMPADEFKKWILKKLASSEFRHLRTT